MPAITDTDERLYAYFVATMDTASGLQKNVWNAFDVAVDDAGREYIVYQKAYKLNKNDR